jgi:GNAT superfamily N-acetyltransferase
VTVRLQPIERDSTVVDAARALLVRALPYDRIDVVWREKLFGDDGARHGRVLGAFEGEALVGLIASAGRFIKLLAVDPNQRRRGVGGSLLDSQPRKMRAGDHPGNYLAPGVDERYADGVAFLKKRGFVERERVENLRVPYAGNPLVSEARADAICQAATTAGYRIAVPTDAELPAVLHMIATEFAAVWANEAAHAWRGPRRSLWVAFAGDRPVAFAAADGNNQGLGWFGPAGTLESHRGKRLGEALLLRCLVAVEGLPEAGVIAWIGPKPFYERAAAAVSDRQFVQLERRDG